MFLFVKWMLTMFHFIEWSLPHVVKVNKDRYRQWSRQQHCRMLLFILSITHTLNTHTSSPNTLTHMDEVHIFLAQTHTNVEWHKHTHILSSRQQGHVSDHGGAWICSVVRANDLRHMSGPCGFKTKHCQERSASAGQPAPCSAALCMRQAIQSSKSKTKPIIVLSHRSVLCPYRLLQTPRVLPLSERLPQICLQGSRGGHDTQETESIHITHCGRSCMAGQGRERGKRGEMEDEEKQKYKEKNVCKGEEREEMKQRLWLALRTN